MSKVAQYDDQSIVALEALEAIRLRPGMYIGDVDSGGYHHLFYELISNSVDEYLQGSCKNIAVSLSENRKRVSIADDGRGIPTGRNAAGIPTLSIVMTKVHAGGKFDSANYTNPGGMNGVGIKACTALSSYFRMRTYRDKTFVEKIIKNGKVDNLDVTTKNYSVSKSGVESELEPDDKIFTCKEFDVEIIKSHMKALSYICPKLSLVFRYNGEEIIYRSDNGLSDMVNDYLVESNLLEKVISKPLVINTPNLSMAMVNISTKGYFNSYVNCINTFEAGSHVLGLKKSFRDALGLILRKNNINIENATYGTIFFLNYSMKDPVFRGQSKSKLSSTLAHDDVYNQLKPTFREYLLTNGTLLNFITSYVSEAEKLEQNTEEIAKANNEINRKVLHDKKLPAKLKRASKGCTNDVRELYIVEGDSAEGSVTKARNPNIQEVLPLKGKILNSLKSDVLSILKSEEVNNIIMALGTGIGDKFDMNQCRYSKIIICADPDEDGKHISSLVLTLFVNYLPEIIKSGKLYIGETPLFGITYKDKSVYGNTHKECFDKYKAKYNIIVPSSINLMRNKGLGEFDPSELKELLMGSSRSLLSITQTDQCLKLVNSIMDGDITRSLLSEEVL
jgi:DNA gyrase subunit B